MARVELGRCYVIVNFEGRRQRGRARVGGYTPRRMERIGTLHELNLPLLGLSVLAPALGDTLAHPEHYALAGIAWALLSEAANTPLPGRFVLECEGRLVPRDDRGMAAVLRLPLPAWQFARDALLPRSGCGFLDYVVVEVDVDEAAAKSYDRARQLELPLGPPPGAAAGAGGPLCAFGVPAADLAPGANVGAERPHERNAPQRAVNETRDDTARDGAPTGGLRPAGHRDGRGAGPGPSPSCASNERWAEAERWDATLRREVQRENVTEARQAFVALLSLTLCGGVTTSRDRRDWGRTFDRLWTTPGRNDEPAGALLRCQRFQKVYAQAVGIGRDDWIQNKPACLNAWLVGQGWRPRAPAAVPR